MILTPEIAERREDLIKVMDIWADRNCGGDRESCAWKILQLHIDMLMVAVEHAARVAQISEDYDKMKGRLK